MNQTNQKEPCYEEMKPYEKFMAKGPEYLSEEELLAIIIRTGTRTMDAMALAKQVLALSKGREKRAARPAASVRRGPLQGQPHRPGEGGENQMPY